MTEYVCIRDEEWVVDNLASNMILSDESKIIINLRQTIAPRIRDFIDMVITNTIWPVCDLRPCQSFIWILESDSVDVPSIRRFFHCCYSLLLSTLSRHYGCNSFNDLNNISNEIASPSFWSIENSEDRQEMK